MAQKIETGPLLIQHGHNGALVIVQFPKMIDNLTLTPQQAEDFIGAMRNSIARLAEHQKTKGAANDG